MNQLITQYGLTMSSRDIADLTKKEHKNVTRTIEALISDSILTAQIEPLSYEHRGNWYRFYELNKRDSLVVVARLSPEFTAAIVDRWQELESLQAPKIPQTYAAALIEAGRLALEVEKQAEQLALAAPKVEFVDRYVASTGNKGFRQVAKLLKAKENEFRSYLSANKILYRLGGEWAPYQCHIDAGRFEVSTGTANEHAYNSARFTPKGVEWIAGLWAVHQLNKDGK
jgi:phage antirepressor YoqD-like protein